MREDLRINKDVVFREFYTHRYILIKSWHNPSWSTKIIRIINRIVLAILVLTMTFYIWDKHISGENIILSLFLIFNPLLLIIIIKLLSEITKETIDLSKNGTLGNSAKRVEYNVYKEYLKTIGENRWFPSIILMFLFFICLLSLIMSQYKWSLNQLEFFWKLDKVNCVYAFISIFGILLIILNVCFFTTLHFRIDNTLRSKIYYL